MQMHGPLVRLLQGRLIPHRKTVRDFEDAHVIGGLGIQLPTDHAQGFFVRDRFFRTLLHQADPFCADVRRASPGAVSVKVCGRVTHCQ